MLNKNSIIDVVIKSSGRRRENIYNLSSKYDIIDLTKYIHNHKYLFTAKRNFNSDITFQKIYSYFQEYLPNELIDKIFSYDTYSSPMFNVYKELILFQSCRGYEGCNIQLDLTKYNRNFDCYDYRNNGRTYSQIYTDYLKDINHSHFDNHLIPNSLDLNKRWTGGELKLVYKDPRTRPSQNSILRLMNKKNKNMEFVLKKMIAKAFEIDYLQNNENEEEIEGLDKKTLVKNYYEVILTIYKRILEDDLHIIYELIWKDCYRLNSSIMRNDLPKTLKHYPRDQFDRYTQEYNQDLSDNFTNRMLCDGDYIERGMPTYRYDEWRFDKHISLQKPFGIENKEWLMEKFQDDFDVNRIPIEFKKSWSIKKMKSVWLNEGREIFLIQLKKKYNKVLKELLKKTKRIEADIVCKDCPSRKLYKYQLCYGCYIIRLSV